MLFGLIKTRPNADAPSELVVPATDSSGPSPKAKTVAVGERAGERPDRALIDALV
jgi:hypothetical protein